MCQVKCTFVRAGGYKRTCSKFAASDFHNFVPVPSELHCVAKASSNPGLWTSALDFKQWDDALMLAADSMDLIVSLHLCHMDS